MTNQNTKQQGGQAPQAAGQPSAATGMQNYGQQATGSAAGSPASGQPSAASMQGAGQQATGMQSAGQMTSAQGPQGQAQPQGQGTQSVVGVFNSRRAAEQAVQQLRQQGFTSEEISIISKKQSKDGGGKDTELVDDDITDGALTGGTLGGIGGLILGAGALAIPGIGPIIAAGPIAAALSGAVAGGITGGLVDWGIPAEVSRQYEQSVAQGGTLAVVRTTAQKVNQAAQILRQTGAQDVQSHADVRAAGR
ncbi:MAG TPA: hypothetical protein PKA10_12960 [Selenomonadales bacterium]|nr:hypothetical protein [Selenomonadales bacterium]